MLPQPKQLGVNITIQKNKETIKFPTVHDLTFDLPEQYCWTDQKNPEWFLLKDTGKDDSEKMSN